MCLAHLIVLLRNKRKHGSVNIVIYAKGQNLVASLLSSATHAVCLVTTPPSLFLFSLSTFFVPFPSLSGPNPQQLVSVTKPSHDGI